MIKHIYYEWQNEARGTIDGPGIDIVLNAIDQNQEPFKRPVGPPPEVARLWFTDGELFVCFEWHDPIWIETEELSREDWPDVNDIISCNVCGNRGWTEMYGDVLPAGFIQTFSVQGKAPNRRAQQLTFCSKTCFDKWTGSTRPKEFTTQYVVDMDDLS
jgi:hypothetical protein